MKKTFSPFYAIFLVAFLISCEQENQSKSIEVEKLVLEVKAVNTDAENIVIDNFSHFVSLEVVKGKSSIELEISLAPGVTMDTPTTLKAVYDLNNEPSFVVKYHGNKIKYTIKFTTRVPEFDPTDKGWVKDETFGTLPAYLSVYKYNKTVDGKAVKAYLAVADMNDPKARFTVLGEYHYDTGSSVPTPTQFYENNSKPVVVLNGGYFWDGYSLGLIIRNGKTISLSQTMFWRDYNGASTVYYPTVGSFGQNDDGSFSVNWSYHTDANTLYTYTSPSPNKAGEKPQPIPSATFPTEGKIWTPKEAIGAGPILIKNGVYKNLWEAEMYDEYSGVGPTGKNPRSSVGYVPSGFLLFFVCEGRYMTSQIPGLTLENEANLLLEIGCTEALALDDGGSSCMLINGKETIKPSDGTQRRITNVVVLY